MSTLVSVIIPTYNGCNTIARAIDSALAQDMSDVEVIVVDDGSTDDTLSVLARYEGRITVVHQDNQGVSVARNTGITLARGRYIAFLDSDDVWYPRKLYLQLRQFAEHPEVGLVASAARCLDEHGNVREITSQSGKGCLLNVLLFDNIIITSSVVVKRECLHNIVPLFRKELPVRQDWEFWIRLAARWEMLITREVMIDYYVSADSLSHKEEPMSYATDDYASEYSALYEYLKMDQLVAPVLLRYRRRIAGHIHFLVACCLYETGYVRKARVELLHAILGTMGRVKWKSVFSIMMMSPAVKQRIKILISTRRVTGLQQVFRSK